MDVLETLRQGLSVYCESGIGLFSTQPVNTISNIAIFISAYSVYQLIKIRHIKNQIIRVLPLLVVLIGVGSILWHGIPNLLTSFADTLPISVLAIVSFFFLLNKLLTNKGLVLGIFLLFILIEVPFILGILPSFNGFIPYLLVFIFGTFVSVGVARMYNLLAQLVPVVIIFAIALLFRTIDTTICPTFPIGTHFIWHILNAFAFYWLIRFLVEIEKNQGIDKM